MKKNFGIKNLMSPMSALMIGTDNDDGLLNMRNATCGRITLEDQITIYIDTSHRIWANITTRKAFTIAFGTANTVASCDYHGIANGNAVANKVAKSGQRVRNAPLMAELLLALECELVSKNEENCNVGGGIVNCAVEESALTDCKLDITKMKPSVSLRSQTSIA